MLTGLNHITLAVADLERSIEYYRGVLGATLRVQWDRGAYLEIGAVWLCLAQGPVSPREDYTHLAFSCEDSQFDDLCLRIKRHSTLWQNNQSEGPSLYFLDPDGHRLELHQGDLQSRLAHYREHRQGDVMLFDECDD